MGMMIIKTKKMSTREVKKKLHEFIDAISEDCGPEIEQMAEELKMHGDSFVDALSGEGVQYRDHSGGYRANDGQGFRNGGGYSHSFRTGGGYKGEFRDDVQSQGGSSAQMRDDIDWNEKEKQRQRENAEKLEQLEAEMRRLKMRMYGNN